MISAKITFSILILLYYVIMIVLIFDFSPIVCLKNIGGCIVYEREYAINFSCLYFVVCLDLVFVIM